jgi:hypothetical protein
MKVKKGQLYYLLHHQSTFPSLIGPIPGQIRRAVSDSSAVERVLEVPPHWHEREEGMGRSLGQKKKAQIIPHRKRRTKMMRTRSKFCMALLFVTLFGMPLGAQMQAGPNRPAGVPEGYVITPFGYFHPTCVLKVAEGETLLADGRIIQRADGTLENLPGCKYAHYAASGEIVAAGATKVESPTVNGWVESASVTTNTSYGEIVATWTVPPAPTSIVGQTVFFFPGMEDSNDVVSIVQPVLQFGPSAAGGGNYWGVASWNCCPSGTADYSTLVDVNPGDTIQGTIKSTCSAGTESCSTWNITTADKTSGKSTTLSNSPSEGQTFNWAFAGVLEAYNIAQCSDYPPNASLTFLDIALYNDNFTVISNPSWSVTYWATSETPQCSYDVQIVSPTEVKLVYGTAPTLTATANPPTGGSVTSSPPGISCPGTCAAPFPYGSKVALFASPNDGWEFVGWGGSCSGMGCEVTMDFSQTVWANFRRNNP